MGWALESEAWPSWQLDQQKQEQALALLRQRAQMEVWETQKALEELLFKHRLEVSTAPVGSHEQVMLRPNTWLPGPKVPKAARWTAPTLTHVKAGTGRFGPLVSWGHLAGGRRAF